MKSRGIILVMAILACLSGATWTGQPLEAAQNKQAFPYRAEVIPGELFAAVYAHDIPTADGKVPCWTFVSEGLEKHGQHEIVFSLRRLRRRAYEDVSGDVLAMFKRLYSAIDAGARLNPYDSGELTTDPGMSFLGLKGPRGLFFLPAEMFDGVDVPFEALAAVLVIGDEMEVMDKSSPLRIASMLGAEYRYYPCPPWSDPSRKPVVSAGQFGKSVLNKYARRNTPGVMIRHSLGREKNIISLRVEDGVAAKLASLVTGLPDKGVVALMTDPDPEATMRYAWLPKAGKTGLIFNKLGPWVTGTFALLVYGEEMEEGGGRCEDGISLILTPSSWGKLNASLTSFRPCEIVLNDGTTVTTEFIHLSTFDPLKPRAFTPASIQLYQSSDELRARAGEDATLKDYIRLFEVTAAGILADADREGARGILIAVMIKPGQQARTWCEAVEGELADDTLESLAGAFGKISPLQVKDGPVAFMLKGTLWDGKVSAFPEFPKAWSDALAASGRPFTSLDDLAKLIWPDR